MIIAAVDDEIISLEVLKRSVLQVDPEAQVYLFSDPDEAEGFLLSCEVDAVFLDIRIYDVDGVTLAKAWKQKLPNLNIIFTTAYSIYMSDAFRLHASGYILKPATPEKVRSELENLRFPTHHTRGQSNTAKSSSVRLQIRCFGAFEVFYDGVPMEFGRSKTKELFAYLIDCQGAYCTNNEIQAVLWEEDGHEAYVRVLRKDLSDTLEKYGCGQLIHKRRGAMAICLDETVECDFEEWKKGTPEGINAYRGEYMSQYSWAEFTHGRLEMDSVTLL